MYLVKSLMRFDWFAFAVIVVMKICEIAVKRNLRKIQVIYDTICHVADRAMGMRSELISGTRDLICTVIIQLQVPWEVLKWFHMCKFQIQIDISSHQVNISQERMVDLIDGKSSLVEEMAWCHQETSHYPSQCWSRSMSPYYVTRPQWQVRKQWIEILDHKFEREFK